MISATNSILIQGQKQEDSKKPFDRVEHIRMLNKRPRTEAQILHNWWIVKQEQDKSSKWKSKHREVIVSSDQPDEVI